MEYSEHDYFVAMKMVTAFKELKKADPNKPRPDHSWMLSLLDASRAASAEWHAKQVDEVADDIFAWLVLAEEQAEEARKRGEGTVSVISPLSAIPAVRKKLHDKFHAKLTISRGHHFGQRLTFKFAPDDTFCSVCGAPQFESSVGLVCENQHFGAGTVSKEQADWIVTSSLIVKES